MSGIIRSVKISVKKVKEKGKERQAYSVSLPKDIAIECGIVEKKEKVEKITTQYLLVRPVIVEIDGRKVKGILYYKPS